MYSWGKRDDYCTCANRVIYRHLSMNIEILW